MTIASFYPTVKSAVFPLSGSGDFLFFIKEKRRSLVNMGTQCLKTALLQSPYRRYNTRSCENSRSSISCPSAILLNFLTMNSDRRCFSRQHGMIQTVLASLIFPVSFTTNLFFNIHDCEGVSSASIPAY